VTIAAYYDVSSSWDAVHNSDKTCEEKLSIAQPGPVPQNNESITILFEDHQRPHYWFIVLISCSGEHYEIGCDLHFQQYQDDWNQEFSYDDQGLLLMYILFFIFFMIGSSINLFSAYSLWQSKTFHPILQLFTISFVLETISLFFLMIHYSIYSNNGTGSNFLFITGQLCDMAAALVFVILLILIAKGWGITFPTLSHIQDQKIALGGIMGVFLILYLVLFFWSLYGVDPEESVYLYQSPPGIAYLVVRVLTLAYFVFGIFQSVQKDTDHNKRVFYYSFGIGYAIWFLGLPFIVILAFVFDEWYRFKAVIAVYLVLSTLGYGFLAFLFWPSRARKYFEIAVPDVLTAAGGYEKL